MEKKKPIRLGVLTIEKVEKLYHNKRDVVVLFGKKICTKATNIHVFMENLNCCKCGLKGIFFAVEQHWDQGNSEWAYIALYNESRQFTKDHIVPRSKGGYNNLKNYQTMCYKCNSDKRNDVKFSDLRKGHCKHRYKVIFHCFIGNTLRKIRKQFFKIRGKLYYGPKKRLKRSMKRMIGYSHATPRDSTTPCQHALRRSGH